MARRVSCPECRSKLIKSDFNWMANAFLYKCIKCGRSTFDKSVFIKEV